MILPGSIAKSDFRPQLNLAWGIAILNILVFLAMNLFFPSWPKKESYKDLQSKNFNQSLGAMYLQTLDPVEKSSVSGLPSDQLAAHAIRDQLFWSRAEKFPFQGDAVQIKAIRKLISILKVDYQQSVQFQFGLGAKQTSPWAWITYQFTHYSLMHLLSNLVFLFLVILYLQKITSSAWIAFVYILGGIGGGVGFLIFNGEGDLSVIGASGSVCALLAFLMIVKKNETMPWTYFLAPVPKAYGQIYLPAFFILPLYLVSDFSSLLWDSSVATSSIAHSAHVGGALVGFALGAVYLVQIFFRSKASAHGVLGDHNGLDKLL
jgi:membrane associated rhomboid family serine protease